MRRKEILTPKQRNSRPIFMWTLYKLTHRFIGVFDESSDNHFSIDMTLNLSKAALCTALLALAAPAAHAGDAKHVLRPLVESSAQRLGIGDEVALSKWDSGASVEDVAREEAVISSAVEQGQRENLAAADVTRFFRAQIEANKLVQYEALATWRRAGYAPPHAPVDLKGTIRPELDRLQTKMIAELAEAAPVLESKECAKEVARAVGRYSFEHQFDPANLPVIALDRAMAGFCRVY